MCKVSKNTRRKESECFKTKRFSTLIREIDKERLINITEMLNLIYQDIIDKGCECLMNDINVIIKPENINNGCTPKDQKRDKRVSIKISESELDYYREVARTCGVSYHDIVIKGIEYWENIEVL